MKLKRQILVILSLFTLFNCNIGYAMDSINFKTMKLPTSANFYLLCPLDYCQAKASKDSPVYNVSVDKLMQAWHKMIKQQPRTTVMFSEHANKQFGYVQRSKYLRFPDFIQVKFIALNDKQSTLAIYSSSRYGYYDFGVNQKRVKSWLKQLEL